MTKKEISELKKASKAVADLDKDISTNAALWIGEQLTNPVTQVRDPKTGKTKKIAPTPWYKQFITTILDDALTNPNGHSGQLLSSTLFTQDILDRLGSQAQKTRKSQIDFAVYRIRQTLYKEQQEVYDNTIDRKLMVVCSRRAGKTELNARMLLRHSLTPNMPALYLNKTFANAINQLFDLVISLANELELTVASSSKTDGTIVFSNGSSIKFGGVNDISAIDKYRGYKFRLVIVDEVGHIKNGQYLIDEVLTPATADYSDSQMVFTGTPPRVKNFATRLWNSNIRKYHWTAKANPFIPDFEEFIQRVCEEKGLTTEDPFIQREYYGNMNAYDLDAVVFKGYKTYEDREALLNGFKKDHISNVYIGVDFGGADNNAIVSVAVDPVTKQAFVYDTWVDRMVGTEVIKAEITRAYLKAIELLARYGYEDDAKKRVHVVTDTNQVEFCIDLNKAGIPAEKAYKYDMMTSVEELSADLRTGRLKVPAEWNEEANWLIKDLNSTVYERDEETDQIIPEIDDSTYHPDAAHALRYAFRNWTSSAAWGRGAGHNASADPTLMPGTENLKEGYTTITEAREGIIPNWLKHSQTEEFIV